VRRARISNLVPGAMLALACAGPPAHAEAPGHTLVPDDLVRAVDVADPRVSPDGRWVSYLVTVGDPKSDEERSSVWRVSCDGREDHQLTQASGDIEKPRWSPDSRSIAFLDKAKHAENSQIELIDAAGGKPRVLTSFHGEIRSFDWSPDGKRLVVVAEEHPTGKAPEPIVVDTEHFKQDPDGYIQGAGKRHLYLLDVQSRRLEKLTSDPKHNEDFAAWAPDGRQIAFVQTVEKGADMDGGSDVDVVEARLGATPKKLVRTYAPNSQRLAWSVDGAQVIYLQGLEPKWNQYIQDHLYTVPSAGGAPQALSAQLDRAVSSYAVASPTTLALTVEDSGNGYLEQLDLATRVITRTGSAEQLVASSVTAAAGHTAMLIAKDHALNEVYAIDNGTLRALTSHNAALLASLRLGAVEEIAFKNRSNGEIHGLIIKPPDYQSGRRYPLMLWIHGGPNEQVDHAFALDGYEFPKQMFAAHGYIVLMVNYRGSSGRGIGFAEAIFADWGHKEIEDLLAGVDNLVARGLADPQRLAVGGWSYGGLLTDYMIASDNRFKVAICGAGSGNQLSTWGSDEYILQYNNELGPPWRDTNLWLKVSYPFFKADRIHTPTLFVGGDQDFNVPIAGGEQMYEALHTLGIATELVIYPGEHHVISRPSFVKDLAQRMLAWTDRFLPPATTASLGQSTTALAGKPADPAH
jgi:dipeptidyl aminopeptidase/acylaminoacyl peptidase